MVPYKAVYDIQGGVSHGFGIKYPDRTQRIEQFPAETHELAFQEAMKRARRFADNHLSDPETGLTIVTLQGLSNDKGIVPLDTAKTRITRSTLQHILTFQN